MVGLCGKTTPKPHLKPTNHRRIGIRKEGTSARGRRESKAVAEQEPQKRSAGDVDGCPIGGEGQQLQTLQTGAE